MKLLTEPTSVETIAFSIAIASQTAVGLASEIEEHIKISELFSKDGILSNRPKKTIYFFNPLSDIFERIKKKFR